MNVESNELFQNSSLVELNQIINDQRLDEKEISAALIAIFFHLKLTQSAFSVILEFFSVIPPIKVPKTFDECSKILLNSTKDKIVYNKFWFCYACKEKTELLTRYSRSCEKCHSKYLFF